MARAAVVLAVGERPIGQASSLTAAFKITSAARDRLELGLPVITMILRPSRLIMERIFKSSSVSPLLETARTTSPFIIIPRSPWMPSLAWRKREGVPVLDNVAAIFRPISPDFPSPED